MLGFDKIHHIAIIGSNYNQSKNFYVNLLGAQVIRETYREDRKDWKIDLLLAGCEIELFIIPDRPKRPSYPEALGLRHLAFQVKDVEKTARELNELGIETEPIRMDDITDKRMTFFFDPDMQPLEIHE